MIQGINELKTICLALGPYRNLTTLTASLLFLHPECQVLNHGSDEVLANPSLNLLCQYDQLTLSMFVDFAVKLSSRGSRGRRGGSILLSHAFDNASLLSSYRSRFKESIVKKQIACLFWKESHRVSTFIREHDINFDALFINNHKIRFLMPIRNPMDCAMSNIKTGHAKRMLTNVETPSYETVLTAIMEEISWFTNLHKKYPDKFFYFFEHTFDRAIVDRMRSFLRLQPDDQWLEDVMSNYNILHPYSHSKHTIEHYRGVVMDRFRSNPSIRDQLLLFDA